MDNVIIVTLKDLLLGSLSFSFLIGLLFWLLKEWISKRIEKSIQHEYDRQLEDYRFSKLKLQKAELVAKLFSKWIKYRGREENTLTREQLIDHYEELNRLSIEVSLWMPDSEILKELMLRLQGNEDSLDIRQITGSVRKLILEKDDDFDYKEICLWPVPEEYDNLFGPFNKGT